VEIFGGDAELPVVIERHTLLLKSLGLGRLIYMFLKEISYAHQCCISDTKKYCKNSNIVKYYYNLK